MAFAAVLLALLVVPSFATDPSALDVLSSLAAPKAAPQVPTPVELPAAPDCIFDGRTGIPTTLPAAIADAQSARVVYAGEKHDSAVHHQAQRRLLELLLAADPRAAAGFEMLHVTHQAALESYLSGAQDATGFQRSVDWPKTWGFPFPLYQPLFDALRASSRRGIALNVPKRIVTKVAMQGLAALTPEERAFIPDGFTRPTDPAYLEMLAATYQAHGGDPAEPVGFGRFVDAQALWNEGMADAVARFASNGPAAPILIIAGAYHAYAAAIPAGVARRLPGARQVSFILLDLPTCPARLEASDLELAADYYWLP